MSIQKLIKLLFIIISSLGISGCHGTVYEDLSCNYQYVDKGAQLKMLVSKDNIHPDIIPNVVEYSANASFILILQNPRLQNYLPLLSYKIRMSDLKLKANGSKEIIASAELADSILKNNPFYQKVFANNYNLWIATKTMTYGPLSLSEYFEKRKALGIPDGLQLNF